MNFRELRKEFLVYIKEKFSPSLVYYPACGADTLPKEVFGTNNVIHLSLPSQEGEFDYFDILGDGIKLYGDMNTSSIAPNSVDLIWFKLEGILPEEKAVNDYERVLKSGGNIAIEEYHRYDRETWDELIDKFSGFKRIDLPEKYTNRIIYGVIPDQDYEDPNQNELEIEIMQDEEDMIDFVSTHQGYLGTEMIVDRAVFELKN